jgi:hypothetical protein
MIYKGYKEPKNKKALWLKPDDTGDNLNAMAYGNKGWQALTADPTTLAGVVNNLVNSLQTANEHIESLKSEVDHLNKVNQIKDVPHFKISFDFNRASEVIDTETLSVSCNFDINEFNKVFSFAYVKPDETPTSYLGPHTEYKPVSLFEDSESYPFIQLPPIKCYYHVSDDCRHVVFYIYLDTSIAVIDRIVISRLLYTNNNNITKYTKAAFPTAMSSINPNVIPSKVNTFEKYMSYWVFNCLFLLGIGSTLVKFFSKDGRNCTITLGTNVKEGELLLYDIIARDNKYVNKSEIESHNSFIDIASVTFTPTKLPIFHPYFTVEENRINLFGLVNFYSYACALSGTFENTKITCAGLHEPFEMQLYYGGIATTKGNIKYYYPKPKTGVDVNALAFLCNTNNPNMTKGFTPYVQLPQFNTLIQPFGIHMYNNNGNYYGTFRLVFKP